MAVRKLPPLDPETQARLEYDYRYGASRLVRQRSHVVLLAYTLPTQGAIAQAVRVHRRTVARTLARFCAGGLDALPRPRPATAPRQQVTARWQELLLRAMEQGPEACGVPRPAWTAPLLAAYLGEQTGWALSERTVRRYLRQHDYRLGRPTYTVRHQAEEQPAYAPKGRGSKRS
jgi:transposase